MSHKTSSHADSVANLRLGFFINTAFVLVEFVAGLSANSLALISDAAHNLTDSLAIGLAYSASRYARRRATARHTFGFGRVGILAASINATILFVTAVLIYVESYSRLSHLETVSGYIVAITAVLGIICNGGLALVAARSRTDLNARAIFFGNVVDVFSSFMALVAGLVVIFTRQTWADPAVSAVIATLLLFAAWEILREATTILSEGVPKGIDVANIRKSILDRPNVKRVNDLHIWAIRSGYTALSCRIVIEGDTRVGTREIVESVKGALSRLIFSTRP